jgi:hypothetical protein
MTRIATIFTVLLILQFNSIKAQQFRIGLRSGLVFTKSVITQENITTKYNTTRFLGGIHLQYQAAKKLALRLGLEFLTRGDYDYYLQHYIDIPLNIIYQQPVQKNKLLFGAGPVWCARVSNNYSYISDMKRNDLGINVFTAYEWPIGFSINLNYTHGMTNMAQDKTYITDYKNRYTGLTIGYLF